MGSMAIAGKNTYRVGRGLVIFDKFVAGCNNADVEAGNYNPTYKGGILGAKNERGDVSGEFFTDNGAETGKIKDRIELNLDNLVIEPRRWNDTFTPITNDDIINGKLKAGQEYYTTDQRSSRFIADGTETASTTAADKYYKLTTKGDQLEWNTALWNDDEGDFMTTGTDVVADDEDRRLLGGNVYGGCYNSGHVNGNVVININQDLIKRDVVFAQTDGEDEYTISGARRSGVLREAQGDDVQAVAMSVFGAGYGKNTEIWGSTTINMNNGYAFQVFGGGEEGVVGKKNKDGVYEYNAAYSSTVNLKGVNAGYSEKESGLPLSEVEYIYGGGSEGDVIGDTYVYSYCSNFNVPQKGSEYGFYSGEIVYMTSDSPMGPFVFGGRVLKNPGAYFGVGGNNHHCMFSFRGKWYITYHAATLDKDKKWNAGYRSTFVDDLVLGENGLPALSKGTKTGVKQLLPFDPYRENDAAAMASIAGAKTELEDPSDTAAGTGKLPS